MLNEKLKSIFENIEDYFIYDLLPNDKEILVFDIESCYIKNENRMFTYSLAFKSLDSDNCYLFDDIDNVINVLMNYKNDLTIYAHNCKYDITPLLIRFTERFGNKYKKLEKFKTKELNPFTKQKELVIYENNKQKKFKKFEYDLMVKNGVFYQLKICNKNGKIITFKDSMKLVPFSLQKCCSEFINLYLPKDGLDYNKERKVDDKLTTKELRYIYGDVFGLSYLIDYLVYTGDNINGKVIKYTALTNSGQSLLDYKQTLLEDFENKQNVFADNEIYEMADTFLIKEGKYYSLEDCEKEKKASCVFNSLFPKLSHFSDKWIRHSYYGGLCTPHYDNIKKLENKYIKGAVFDVNSLYPFTMKTMLLPYGLGHYYDKPYKEMSEEHKKIYPLYIQELTIYRLDLKKNKMHFLQIKNSQYFKGTDILKNNIKDGKRVTVKVRLCNPILDMLFENYNVVCEFGAHFAFKGTHNIFENYLEYWGKIKQENKGGKRATAKLRQNGLYGKFGMSGVNIPTHFVNVNNTFTLQSENEEVTSETIYLPLATFITSYAKAYLLKAINSNFKYFLYCDTDSIHLSCTKDKVKGITIDSKIYGAWDNECEFFQYKYIGPKRYAENVILENKSSVKLDNIILTKWVFKCCGLTAKIMNNITNSESFNECEHNQKEIDNMKLYRKGVQYYYDKECKKIVKGLYASNKAKQVKYGICILEQPYKITSNTLFYK